jgi:hypothetical protein
LHYAEPGNFWKRSGIAFQAVGRPFESGWRAGRVKLFDHNEIDDELVRAFIATIDSFQRRVATLADVARLARKESLRERICSAKSAVDAIDVIYELETAQGPDEPTQGPDGELFQEPQLTQSRLRCIMPPIMHRTRIRAFAAATFFYWAALYIYVPTLPSYVKEKTSSLTDVGVVLSMFGLWEAILRTPLGVIVDATGHRKRFLLSGCIAAAIGALILAHSSSIGILTFGRALTGASSAIWAPMIVVFASFYPADRLCR